MKNNSSRPNAMSAKLENGLKLLAQGLDPNGHPLDFSGAAAEARTSAQLYARQIALGQARTAQGNLGQRRFK